MTTERRPLELITEAIERAMRDRAELALLRKRDKYPDHTDEWSGFDKAAQIVRATPLSSDKETDVGLTAAVEREREECARVADDYIARLQRRETTDVDLMVGDAVRSEAAEFIAAVIRGRSKQGGRT